MADRSDTVVVRSDSDEVGALLARGWRISARSFGAHLNHDADVVARLRGLMDDSLPGIELRALETHDVPAVLALDACTLLDYPGGSATQHLPLTVESATPTVNRRGFGAFDAKGNLIAMTYIDLHEDGPDEVDFTVVDRSWRARGVGIRLKASSLLHLMDAGRRAFRTGGSLENTAILKANEALGFEIDEMWLTFVDSAPLHE